MEGKNWGGLRTKLTNDSSDKGNFTLHVLVGFLASFNFACTTSLVITKPRTRIW